MKLSGLRGAILLTAASFAAPAAIGQVPPESPVHVTVNGVFFLCPKLVRGESAPDAGELAKLGFEAREPSRKGEQSFKATSAKGILNVSYHPSDRRCVLDYGGPGYEAIAGIVRDMVKRNGLLRLTGGDKDGAKADVFEGPVPQKSLRARVIIIENYTSSTSSISYSERVAS